MSVTPTVQKNGKSWQMPMFLAETFENVGKHKQKHGDGKNLAPILKMLANTSVAGSRFATFFRASVTSF